MKVRYVIGGVAVCAVATFTATGADAHQPSLALTCGHVRAEMFLYPAGSTYTLTVDGTPRALAGNGVYESGLNPDQNHSAAFVIVSSDGIGNYSQTLVRDNCVPTTTTTEAPTTTAAPTTTEATTSTSTSSTSTTTAPSTSTTGPATTALTEPTSTLPSTDSSTPSTPPPSSAPSPDEPSLSSTPSTTECQTSSTNSESSPNSDATVSSDCGESLSGLIPSPSPPQTSLGDNSTTPSALPSTGPADTAGAAIAGGLCLILGGVALIATRRRGTQP